jgi:hypothetical protein
MNVFSSHFSKKLQRGPKAGREEIRSDSCIPVPNISFFIGKSKMNFRFAQPARKLLRKETFCGTLKL